MKIIGVCNKLFRRDVLIMINTEMLKKYANLSLSIGVNLQKDQILVVKSPVECADFTRILVEEAYKKGASEVVVLWNDEQCTRLNYLYSPIEVLEDYPDWLKDSVLYYAKKGAAILSISASNPELMKGINSAKIAAAKKAASIATREFSARIMTNENPWSIISLPTKAWAKKVYPDVSSEEAINKLWETIFNVVRVNEDDPVAAWETHKNNLIEKMKYLNEKNFKTLHFKNNAGTDLYVDLAVNHIWCGGAESSAAGIEFIANMPTEEIFTMPKRDGVNGRVVSSKPLNYSGSLINNFALDFKDGKVVSFEAEEGYDALKGLLDTDEGASHLGEVALVPFDSPISNSNTIFYNTLYDENASCHLAFGKAYNLTIEGGKTMSTEELMTKGGNDSLVHVDFMIGTKDLNITGIAFDGTEAPIFADGNWAF